MPAAGDMRRGAPLFPAPPAEAPDAPHSWLRWLGFNLWLFACVIVAVGLALVAVSELAGAGDGDDPPFAAYAWMCLYLPFTWPLYMGALVLFARRGRHPRRWAIALTPLLFALFPYAVLTFVAPGIAASWIAYFVYGAIVRLPPLTRPASAATSR
jgi:hypothetical protein